MREKPETPKQKNEVVAHHWESRTLFWSSKPLPGYQYSRKKDAYWRAKEDIKKESAISIDTLVSCVDVLIFTSKCNVHIIRHSSSDLLTEPILKIKLERDEYILYHTTTQDYSGYLITAFENGKIAKVLLRSFFSFGGRKK